MGCRGCDWRRYRRHPGRWGRHILPKRHANTSQMTLRRSPRCASPISPIPLCFRSAYLSLPRVLLPAYPHYHLRQPRGVPGCGLLPGAHPGQAPLPGRVPQQPQPLRGELRRAPDAPPAPGDAPAAAAAGRRARRSCGVAHTGAGVCRVRQRGGAAGAAAAGGRPGRANERGGCRGGGAGRRGAPRSSAPRRVRLRHTQFAPTLLPCCLVCPLSAHPSALAPH